MAGGRAGPIQLEEGWAYMENGITKLKKLLEGNNDEQQFEADHYMQLYTTIYNMCTQKPPHDFSSQLYQRYTEAFVRYITEKVLPSLREQRDEFLLKELYHRWSNHKVMVRWLSRFFNYLDRYYITRHSLANLQDVGLQRFRDHVYAELKKKTKDALLALIEKEREGEAIDRSLVKNVLGIFIEVGMGTMDCYQKDFEELKGENGAPGGLLDETGAYYRRKASVWVVEDSCPDYMQKAEEVLRAEEERVVNYLHIDSKQKLLQVVEEEILTKFELQLLEKEHSGCACLLKDDKKADLARMYRLFSRVPKGLEPVADIFKKHVEAEGMKLVKEATETSMAKTEKSTSKGPAARVEGGSYENQFIRDVIALHDKYLEYVVESFNNGSLFHKSLKEAFEAFCNRPIGTSTMAELMATFCDNLLKKGSSEKLTDEGVEEMLEKVVKLLAYISDKDLFSEFYRKRLARRLLHDRSSSDDHERSLVSRLKQQCGAQFTSRMEGMVTDLQLAREKQQSFDTWKNDNRPNLALSIDVTVLTTGNWPTYKAVDLKLPSEMMEGLDAFKEFYEGTTKHRRLTWIYSLGQCTIKAPFEKGAKELIVSTFQAAILVLFNDNEELSFTDIKDQVNLPEEEVGRTLHSLTLSKYKILVKKPPTKVIGKEDTFSVNTDFADRLRRIKVPNPPVDEKKKVIEDVEKDRRYSIDAAIVRTMKSRKILQHSQLVMEVVQQLQRMFNPDVRLIKKRIEDLIQRDYLERDKDNSNIYKYMA